MSDWLARLDTALRSMGGFALVVSDGRITGVNPEGVALLGYADEAELVGRLFIDLLPPEWRPAASILTEPSGVSETIQFLRPDGSRVEVELSCLPDPEGSLLVGRDVSERRRMGTELLDGVVRFRALMQAAPVGILIVDENDQIADCNAEAMALLGGVPGAALGDPAESWLQDLWVVPGRHGAVSLRRRDGSLSQVDLAVNETDHHGRRLRIVTLVDIRERLAMERERAALRDELREAQKIEALGQMASGVAHEFNNLLVPIMSMTALVRDRLPTADPNAPLLGTVLEAANLARDLVKRLLAFSRSDDGEGLRPVDLAMLLRRLMPLLRSSIPKTILLSLEVVGDPHWIAGDPPRLQQAVLNLCNNAMQAIEGGHGHIGLWLAPGPDGGVLLRVDDDGCGIDPAVIGRVFDPFFTTKAPGEGTGLGLSTVQTIVREHGGRIAVESAPGSGSTFMLLLPALAREQWPDETPAA